MSYLSNVRLTLLCAATERVRFINQKRLLPGVQWESNQQPTYFEVYCNWQLVTESAREIKDNRIEIDLSFCYCCYCCACGGDKRTVNSLVLSEIPKEF